MCGIFALLNIDNNVQYNKSIIETEFNKGKGRGPENSKLVYDYYRMILGFHRLAINGLDEMSNQPIVYNDVVLICNGEIYNYKELYRMMNVTPVTNSDCEVIIHLYLKYGIDQTLIMLDGVYAFVLYDNRLALTNKLYVARDPMGVRPMYYLKNMKMYGFASEIKCLEYFYNDSNLFHRDTSLRDIDQFKPGTYSVYELNNDCGFIWKPLIENKPYIILSFPHTIALLNDNEHSDLLKSIGKYVYMAVVKRCVTTERPIACLLSGGLDSSLIASIVSDILTTVYGIQIETYSIGLEGSEDIKYAQIVANYIGSKHTEIIVSERDMFEAIPEVIKAIESYDTTTVRASIGNYLIGKYISKNSEAKVIFNGDGSDELFGGYLYMRRCPDDIEFDKETRRLLSDIHLFDVLRSDKSISSHGLEPRTPFLDRNLVNYILSIPAKYRNHNNIEIVSKMEPIEKFLLRSAFHPDIFVKENGEPFLPNDILFRRKEAFSDGVSSKGRSLFNILQEFIANYYNQIENTTHYVPSIELEKRYYKDIFDREYPNCSHILPYFWMPKYTTSNDPSARTLDVYNN
jgi:asparagine synthase (glutamine-hydrolysing)